MIGLGVGIDYALFWVEPVTGRAFSKGGTPKEAVMVSLATSGRAVVFAGTTVHPLGWSACSWLQLPSCTVLAVGGHCRAVVLVMLAAVTLPPRHARLRRPGQRQDPRGRASSSRGHALAEELLVPLECRTVPAPPGHHGDLGRCWCC